jgi:hypothetical protein
MEPAAIETVFTPGAPIGERSRLVGRDRDVAAVEQVLGEPGRHLLLIGDPGVGRTSLALACAASRTVRYHQVGLGESFDLLLGRLLHPDDTKTPEGSVAERVWQLAERVPDRALVLIIDDVQQATPAALDEGLVPLLRALSDAGAATKVILTARWDLPYPAAFTRVGLRLVALPVERLDPEALVEIVSRGGSACGLTYAPDLARRIALDADGMPGLAHALALGAGRSAQQRGGRRVTMGRDYLPALTAVVQSLGPQLQGEYEAIANRPAETQRYAHLLWAGAVSPEATFDLDTLERGISRIAGRELSRQAFTKHLGTLLQQGVFSRIREGHYRFASPVLRLYVRLKLRAEQPGLMGEDPLQLGLPY